MIRLSFLWTSAVAAAAAALACSNAPQAVAGDDLRLPDPCRTFDPDTWTGLYACYFGRGGQASCAGEDNCHGGPSEKGTHVSGFVCTSKDTCWASMTQLVDGAGEFPIVCLDSLGCPGGTSDPTQAELWAALQRAGVTNPMPKSDNMPCGDPTVCDPGASHFTFDASDLAHISTWLQQGAQDN